MEDLPDEDKEQMKQNEDNSASFYTIFNSLGKIEKQGVNAIDGFNLNVQQKKYYNPYDVPRRVFEVSEIDARNDRMLIVNGKAYPYLNYVNKYTVSQMICSIKLNINKEFAQDYELLLAYQKQYKSVFFVVGIDDIITVELLDNLAIKYKEIKKLNICVPCT